MTASGRHIWVVDDEPDVLAYLLAALEDAGYEARGFDRAEALLEALKESEEPSRPMEATKRNVGQMAVVPARVGRGSGEARRASPPEMGREALPPTANEHGRPDLVCLDILLPEQSGLSLYRTLRRTPGWKGIPIVMVSGYSRREEFEAGEFTRLMGDDSISPPDGFVEKPVSLPELMSVLVRLLGPTESAGSRHAGEATS